MTTLDRKIFNFFAVNDEYISPRESDDEAIEAEESVEEVEKELENKSDE